LALPLTPLDLAPDPLLPLPLPLPPCPLPSGTKVSAAGTVDKVAKPASDPTATALDVPVETAVAAAVLDSAALTMSAVHNNLRGVAHNSNHPTVT
jgi:hypothetical protein